MEIVKANKDNLASVIMGKNIYLPWRGQKELIIQLPYSAWLDFIKERIELIQYRKPLDYRAMLSKHDDAVNVRYFMYECAWALYSELAITSSRGEDATLILPYFDSGENITLSDIIDEVRKMSTDDFEKYHSYLRAATKNYYDIGGMNNINWILLDTENLSDWNRLLFYVCIYIQSRSSKYVETKKLNIDLEGIV